MKQNGTEWGEVGGRLQCDVQQHTRPAGEYREERVSSAPRRGSNQTLRESDDA
jgi:hypothetical protein